MERSSTNLFALSKSFRGWAVAIAGAIGLNIILFGLMPGLIQKAPPPPDKLDVLKNIQVIRMKKAPNPALKKTPKKTKKPEQLRQVTPQPLHQAPLKKKAFKPRLDFKLNTKLPATPMDIAIPALEKFSVEGPVLKGVYDMAELDTGLMALVKIPPIYPARAKRRGIEGFVTIGFQVSSKGLVENITIIEAKPAEIFNQSVKTCVSHWKFKPPTIEGVPVAAMARTTIHFQLE